MSIVNRLKRCHGKLTIAIAFAVTMLLSSYLLADHQHANTLMLLLIGFYFTVVQRFNDQKRCSKTAQ